MLKGKEGYIWMKFGCILVLENRRLHGCLGEAQLNPLDSCRSYALSWFELLLVETVSASSAFLLVDYLPCASGATPAPLKRGSLWAGQVCPSESSWLF